MSNAIYASLTRQDGLLREMQVIANNMANSSTTGFKSNHAIFAEHIAATGDESGSLSMGSLAGHNFDLSQGAMKHTGGQFDLAIHGEGFFVLDTPAGERLTRAGAFQLAPGGYQQVEEPAVVQGTLEQSNVSSILEVSRLIEVQRAYEAGQSLIEKEDERINQLIKTMRQL